MLAHSGTICKQHVWIRMLLSIITGSRCKTVMIQFVIMYIYVTRLTQFGCVYHNVSFLTC